MIAPWMLYTIVVSALIGMAAIACERMLRLAGQPARWAWGAALLTSVAIPLMGVLAPPSPVGGPIRLEDASATLIDPALLFDLLNVQPTSPGVSMVTAAALGLWIGASLFLGGVLALSQLRIRRETETCPGEIVDGVLVRHTSNLGPAVVGSFPSIIVLPAWVGRLQADWRKLVMSHEQEHIRAGDAKLLLAGVFVAVLFPWNLPLWWQLRRLRDAVELDCDERVLRSGVDARAYGELLLEVARHRSDRLFPAPALSNPKSLLARRIHKMTNPSPKARTLRAGIAASAATLLVALACETQPPAAVSFDDELGVVTQVSDVYGEDQVEVQPERVSGPMPRYPAMLRQAGIEGAVQLEFVIDKDGRVDETTIEVVESSNRAFEAPAIAVVAGSVFKPGAVDGEPVNVLVQQRIGFTIDGDQARREATEVMEVLRAGPDVGRPLIMIDDEIVSGGIPEKLNPDHIDRIEVIKSAAAEELVGERGANGIIKIYLKEIAITATAGNN